MIGNSLQANGLADVTTVNIAIRSRQRNLWNMLVPSFSNIFLSAYVLISLMMNGGTRFFKKQGFFCDDSTISYPYKPDTVGYKLLLFIVLVCPAIVIKICDRKLNELLADSNLKSSHSGDKPRSNRTKAIGKKTLDTREDCDVEAQELIASSGSKKVKRRHLKSCTDLNSNSVTGSSCSEDSEVNLFSRVPLDSNDKSDAIEPLLKSSHESPQSAWIRTSRTSFSELQFFFFGLATTMLFTGIGKATCGRLRPHFLQRCLPDVDCTKLENFNRYIADFRCTNELKNHELFYISTSWPSGHASAIFFSMLYLVIYLNSTIPKMVRISSGRISRRFDPMFLNALYVLMMCLAFYIALTRVSDYHHHPLDVFSGSLIGTLTAVTVSKSFPRSRPVASLS